MKETDSFNPPNQQLETNPPNQQLETNPPNQQLETKLEVPTEKDFEEYENKHPLLSGSLAAAKHPREWKRITGCSTRTIILVTVASFALGLAIGKFTAPSSAKLWR